MAGSQAGSCRGWELAVPAGARCLAFLFFFVPMGWWHRHLVPVAEVRSVLRARWCLGLTCVCALVRGCWVCAGWALLDIQHVYNLAVVLTACRAGHAQ